MPPTLDSFVPWRSACASRPSRSSLQVSERAQERLAFGLAMIAGYVDAYGFISYRTYVSFMSGNTTQTGFLIGQGHLAAAVPALLAIVCFLVGVFTGTLRHSGLTHSGAGQSHWLPFGWVATLLAVDIGVTHFGPLASAVGIATLSLAMGLMNTALSRVGAQSVNLVFVTGTLNTMAQHLALAVKRAPLPEAQGSWDTHRRRAFLLMGVWASFLTGAVLAGVGTSRFGVWVLLLPVMPLLALARRERVGGRPLFVGKGAQTD
jgi:uncharacterized membrane protein YoaK (UPF0700 family)